MLFFQSSFFLHVFHSRFSFNINIQFTKIEKCEKNEVSLYCAMMETNNNRFIPLTGLFLVTIWIIYDKKWTHVIRYV